MRATHRNLDDGRAEHRALRTENSGSLPPPLNARREAEDGPILVTQYPGRLPRLRSNGLSV
jgi:hypothetical protein